MMSEKWIVFILVLASFLILSVHLSYNSMEFSQYNHEWNGTSDFFDLLNRHTTQDIENVIGLDGKENTTLLIIAPVFAYSQENIKFYHDYIASGNTIFLADESGTGNNLLRGIGSNMSIKIGPLASLDKAYNNSYIVVTSVSGSSILTQNVTSLVLDQSAVIEGGEPLIQSSMFSWLDADHDKKNTNEPLQNYAIFAHEKIGNGEIYVLSDPSIFINAMGTLDEKWNNKVFLNNIITAYPNLLVDRTNSRTCMSDGLGGVILTLKTNPFEKIVLVGLIFGIILIIGRKRLM